MMNARLQLAGIPLFVALAVLSACNNLTTQPDPSAWEAEILGESSYFELTGTLGAASQMGTTIVAVAIHGVPSESFNWTIETGTCTVIGSRVGAAAAYPEIVTNAQGSGSSEAELNQMLSPQGRYVVVIRTLEGEIAGCGALVRQQFSVLDRDIESGPRELVAGLGSTGSPRVG